MNLTPHRKIADLFDVAGLFLRLGFTAFGGPAAHIAMMEQEAVVRRGWLSREEFLDLLGVVNLIPGPNSTELAIFLGYRRAGWMGLLLGGVCFILPAALIVSVIAWGYLKFGKMPETQGLLYGIKPVIIAVVVQALWNLGRTAVKTKMLAIAGVGAAALSFFGINPLLVLLITGVFMLAVHAGSRPKGDRGLPDAVVGNDFRSAAGGGDGRGGAVQSVGHVPVLSQGRVRVVWQRLRAAGVFARRSGRTLALAH